MLSFIITLLFTLWLAGFVFQIGGALIHILLLFTIAILVFSFAREQTYE